MQLVTQIKNVIRDVKDFPREGVLFKDITPIFSDAKLVADIVSHFVEAFRRERVDAVVGIEARGFIFGVLLAQAMNCPFVPVRKAGKLPYKTRRQEYTLEYGTSAVEMHIDAVQRGWRVLIHDDVLATGGTATAAGELVMAAGARLAGFCFILNLRFLDGAKRIKERFEMAPHFLVEY